MPFHSIFDGRLVPKGENENGFRALVPSGVASDSGMGCNHQYTWGPNINGSRWAMPPSETDAGMPFCAGNTVGAPQRSPKKNMNRSGE